MLVLRQHQVATLYQVAVNKVTPVLDDPEGTDLRTIDVEATLDRFVALHGSAYMERSLGAYKSRFRNVVAMFLAWVDGDRDWRSGSRPTPASASSGTVRSDRMVVYSSAQRQPERALSSNRAESAGGRREVAPVARNNPGFEVNIPLRGGTFVVTMRLPLDLTPDDARRIAGVVSAYAGATAPAAPADTGGAR